MASVLKFGLFELDRRNFELRRDGQAVKLGTNAIGTAVLFCPSGGHACDPDEAVEHVCGKEVFVEAESSLYTAVRKVRRALDDNIAKLRFIQTDTASLPKSMKFRLFPCRTVGRPAQPAREGVPGCFGPCCLVYCRSGHSWFGCTRGILPESIVVPLENLSGNPQQEYLAEDITEEITAELARLGREPRSSEQFT